MINKKNMYQQKILDHWFDQGGIHFCVILWLKLKYNKLLNGI
jgi:hypothetical protein